MTHYEYVSHFQQAIMQSNGSATRTRSDHNSARAGGHPILLVTLYARSPARLLFIGYISQGPSHNGVIYPLLTHVVPRYQLWAVINKLICI